MFMPDRTRIVSYRPQTAARRAALAASGWSLALALVAVSCNQAAVVSGQTGGPMGGAIEPRPPTGGAGGAGGAPIGLPDADLISPPATPDAAAPGDVPIGPCKPLTCTPTGGRYCGKVGDGCGGIIDCGNECAMATTCGGGGVKGLCGAPRDPSCKAITCEQVGGRLCGRVGDGCGGALECGVCPGGDTCGGTIANVCGNGPAGVICDNLCKQQVSCPGGQDTTVTGTVFAPTPARFGPADPLYNAVVYVPNRPLAPFTEGVSCDLCGAAVSGSPLVTALSGADGKFTLKNVPAGTDIPLVIQIGRWRRQVVIPKVTACTATPLPAELTRLPRNQREGNIPQMAIATGIWDPFDCVLRQVGIDESEFTAPTGNGRVHVYKFGGHGLAGAVPSGNALVGNRDTLGRYDMVLLPCDDDSQKPNAQLANLRDYTARGGRLFLTDFSYSWLKDGDAFEANMNWLDPTVEAGDDFSALIDQSFPKGQAFAEWLRVVGASQMPGTLPIHDPYGGVSYIDRVIAPAQRWLYTDSPDKTVQHLTFNTPAGVAADKQCGRVVFSTFHVAEDRGGIIIPPINETFPGACPVKPMTPQERALEFMLFDASACVMPDSQRPSVFEPPPAPPPPPPTPIE